LLFTQAGFYPIASGKKTDQQKADQGSLWLIWVLIIIGNVSAVFIPHYLIAAIGPAPAVGYFGLVLIILGLLLRIGAIRSLGNSLRCR
jgi:protein-S-isoprenylcysteine O-methyltransferase Ste14